MTGPATATVTPWTSARRQTPAGFLHPPSARRLAARDEPDLMGTVRDGGSCRQGVVFQSP
jgi:hypothetical protein